MFLYRLLFKCRGALSERFFRLGMAVRKNISFAAVSNRRGGGEVVKCCKNFTKTIDVKFCKIELNVAEPLAITSLEQDETR